ncbi:hypothetical protein D6T63_15600 [Arthrobacter cheniae]|uniref:Uncharacterized protein n=1 Tax=Arthrobacter cheniae TaxID=1258888 RepID=A0A3A5MAJ0_9MICC|nr:hypothetical protein [Arthrobacter cheniae]RJT76896.1 hypothetical protein D6T63_15600 [Arthrobacter cheniae]
MPKMLLSMNHVSTQADYVRVAVDEDAMLAWLQENPKENDWIQPVSDKDDICAEDVRRYFEAHPELRDHRHFHEAAGEVRESWSQLEIIDPTDENQTMN